MTTLPSELLDRICFHADGTSLKDLRLVSRIFEDLASPYLFESIHTACIPSLMRAFEAIASSRHAKCVRRLVVYGDVLPLMTRDDWEETVNHSLAEDAFAALHVQLEQLNQLAPRDCSPSAMQQAWDEYERLYRDQQSWTREVEGLRFRTLLAALPNLRVVELLTDMDPDRDAAIFWPFWRSLRERIYLAPTEWNQAHAQFGSGQHNMRGEAALNILQGLEARNRSSNSSPVTALTLHMDVDSDFSLASELGNLHIAREALVPLKSFRLRWIARGQFQFHEEDSLRLPLESELDELLQSMTKLENLLIDWQQWSLPCETGGICRLKLFSRHEPIHYPHLKDLSLFLDVPVDDLVPFFKHHADTLKQLTLKWIAVKDGPELLKSIHTNLKLDVIKLQHIWSAGRDIVSSGIYAGYHDAEEMKEYLLRKRDEMPDFLSWPTKQ